MVSLAPKNLDIEKISDVIHLHFISFHKKVIKFKISRAISVIIIYKQIITWIFILLTSVNCLYKSMNIDDLSIPKKNPENFKGENLKFFVSTQAIKA